MIPITKYTVFIMMLSVFSIASSAQESNAISKDSLDKKKIFIVGISMGTAYTASMIGLNYLWYKDYPRSSFHFFNDNKEWLQVDKVGHFQSAYFQSLWTMKALEWSGVDRRKAAWYGAGIGLLFQSSIEIYDGFSSQWGASPGDLVANSLGSFAMLSQELLWREQRISFKYSMHLIDYPEGILRDRANNLYGTGFMEKMLKDYNGQVYWLSVNTASFIPSQKRWKWLNVAVGYGAGGMYGGFSNSWTDKEGNQIVFPAERYRQFFLSVDADLSKIPLKRKGYKPLLYLLNIFKMPAPALEFNTKGQIKFHPVYFMNFDLPIHIKN